MIYLINKEKVKRKDIVSLVGEDETKWYEKLSQNLFEIGCYQYTSKVNEEIDISFVNY